MLTMWITIKKNRIKFYKLILSDSSDFSTITLISLETSGCKTIFT